MNMKKITLLILIAASFFGAQAQTVYQLNYDSIRVGKTTGLGGTSLYGKVYFKNVTPGLVKLNADGKLISTTYVIGDITGLQDSLTVKANKTFDNVATNAIAIAKVNGLQTALDAKSPIASPTFTGTVTIPTPFTLGAVSVLPTGTELNFVDGVTSNIQTQLDTKIGASFLSATLPLFYNSGTGVISSQAATGSQAGYLTAADWTTFNAKQAALTNPVTGTGTSGYSVKFTGTSTIGNSIIYDDGTNIGLGTITPYNLSNYRFLTVNGPVSGGGLVMQKAGVSKGTVYTANDDLYIDAAGKVVLQTGGVVGSGVNALELSAAGVMKIPQLTGTVTDMVTITNDGTIGRTAIPSGAGGGTVISVGVVTANGLAGTSSGGDNPALTLTTTVTGMVKGNGTALSAATAGTDYTSPTGTENLSNKTITGSTISGYMPTIGGIFAGQVGINTGSSSVADLDHLFLTNSGENGANILFNNAFGNLASVSGSKAGTGADADDGVIIFKTATTSVLAEKARITNDGLSVTGAGAFTGALSASNLSGTHSGASSGTNTGDQTSVTGNAGTATALQTARTISGTSFDGTANITLNNTGITNGAGYITSSALSPYAPLASPTFTGTVSGITKTMVGLSNVDNTSDAAKPVSTAQQTALDLKANLASPALTGTPTAPTASAGTNTTQIATMAALQAAISTYKTVNAGTLLIDGDGTTTSFPTGITESTSITPSNIMTVTAQTAVASAAHYLTIVAVGGGVNHWYINFVSPPASGTGNIKFSYTTVVP